jgi:hypothetical protein
VDGSPVDPISVEPVEPLRQKIQYTVTRPDIESITIELVNKESNDTVVIDGTITEDLFLTVDQLVIDDIDLLNNLSKISVYKDRDGNVHRTYNYISFKGVMTIKIHKNLLYTNWLANFL